MSIEKKEDPQIVDANEGKFDFFIRIDGEVELKKKRFDTLFQGAMGLGDEPIVTMPGKFCCDFENIYIVKSKESSMVLRDELRFNGKL